jgi:hypothetical protein
MTFSLAPGWVVRSRLRIGELILRLGGLRMGVAMMIVRCCSHYFSTLTNGTRKNRRLGIHERHMVGRSSCPVGYVETYGDDEA